MKDILAIFDSLLKRGLSASFIFAVALFLSESFIFIVFDMNLAELTNYWVSVSKKLTGNQQQSIGTVLFISFIGINYLLVVLNEALYENTLRGNFEVCRNPFFNNSQLIDVREKVQSKLMTIEELPEAIRNSKFTDYNLYEIVGGLLDTNTRGYLDSAKTTGLVFISLVSAITTSTILHWTNISSVSWGAALISFSIILFYIIGRELVKTHYRSRAYRIYFNFLIAPNTKIVEVKGDWMLGITSEERIKKAKQPNNDNNLG